MSLFDYWKLMTKYRRHIIRGIIMMDSTPGTMLGRRPKDNLRMDTQTYVLLLLCLIDSI